MAFRYFGGECASAILDIRPAAAPDIVSPKGATTDLVRLFALDRVAVERRLICRWRRQTDGRLACLWEPDIVLIPQR